jgi:hypothetical protein
MPALTIAAYGVCAHVRACVRVGVCAVEHNELPPCLYVSVYDV